MKKVLFLALTLVFILSTALVPSTGIAIEAYNNNENIGDNDILSETVEDGAFLFEESIDYASMDSFELAYADIYAAPEEWKEKILEARSEVIFSTSWAVNGAGCIVHTDGTIEELPEFSELFPGWDVPRCDISPEYFESVTGKSIQRVTPSTGD